MHVVHVTAHLGGGVGKAHAALRTAMPAEIRQTYLLLEQPRDRRYADEISAHGGDIVFADGVDDIVRHCAAADIVQFEFWNHPKLLECLARADFPVMRSVFWSHVSGLFRPVIAPGFYAAADRFVFTTPASMVLRQGLAGHLQSRLSSIGSGFGFADFAVASAIPSSVLPDISPKKGESGWAHPSSLFTEPAVEAIGSPDSFSPLVGEMPGRAERANPEFDARFPITYLGTVDFIKLNPGFFDAVDALNHPVTAAIWGTHDPLGEVAAKAAAMRHPDRIRFMGQTPDPQTVLAQSRILFYPLQPDHYGTAENALIEAMSLGLVPVVLANPAECAILDHGITGFIGHSISDCVEILDRLLASPDEVARIGTNAARHARQTYTAERSAQAFVSLWMSLIAQPKHPHDFHAVTGNTPLDWYLATQTVGGEETHLTDASTQQSKGTLAHFRAAFPDDPCWNVL